MSCRIDDLEKNIADLMTQAGVEELEGENKAPATKTSSENHVQMSSVSAEQAKQGYMLRAETIFLDWERAG